MGVRRAVTVYVLNGNGQVLMLNHKKLGYWMPPGGKLEDEEMIHRAAERELKEETGLVIEFVHQGVFDTGLLDERAEVLPQPLLIQYECEKWENFIYLARAKNNEIENREDNEIGWFNIEDALKLKIFENVKKHLRYIQEKMG